MKISNFSIASKLWLALACVMLLLGLTVFTAFKAADNLNGRLDAIAKDQSDTASEFATLRGLAQTYLGRTQISLSSADPSVTELVTQSLSTTQQQIAEVEKRIADMELSSESRALVQRIHEQGQAVEASYAKASQLKLSGDKVALDGELKSAFLPTIDRYAQGLDELVSLQRRESANLPERFAAMRKANSWIAKSMVAFVLLLLAMGTWLLIQQIRQPLRSAIKVAETIAAGDLSAKVGVDRGDEFGEMLAALGHMRDQLAHLVDDVRQGADGMVQVSEEIATGNHDLSQRTEQSAANLEETASSMHDLTSTVSQSADSARRANQLASTAAQVANRGGQVVNQVVTTMEEINVSSRKISDIISVIDGIAFQTNILALNAAVEAARAGEQGRGFAVVASEVRSLAGRSAEAAKEIKLLINTSVEKVADGTHLVGEAGKTMVEIVGSIQQVTDIMGGISASTSEQSEGIAQVNAAISQLDQMTQQNAALVEQSAAAASSMKDQAQRLAQLVAAFKLREGTSEAINTSKTLQPISSNGRSSFVVARQSVVKPYGRVARKASLSPPAISKFTTTMKIAAEKNKGDDDWETF